MIEAKIVEAEEQFGKSLGVAISRVKINFTVKLSPIYKE